jgi:type II secretory pathway component GspD/PulD (secretin)
MDEERISAHDSDDVGAIRNMTVAAMVLVGLAGVAGAAEGGRQKTPTQVGCKPPAPKRKIKVNLKPDTEVADLIAWYSTLTCTPLMVSSGVAVAGKKVTIFAPAPVSVAEIDSLFRGALESVGLTLQRDGKFLYVIDATRARHSNTPVVPAR